MPSPIEIYILGSGSAIPTLQRKHPAVALRYEGECLLFDCGECTQLGLQKAGISPMKIKRIFITHWHADHFAGLLPLIETLHMLGRKKALYIYGPEARRFVDYILELSYLSFGFKIKAKDVSIEEKERIVNEKKYYVYSFPVRHSVPCVAYIFQEKAHWKMNPQKLTELKIPREKIRKLKARKKINLNGKEIRLAEVAEKIEGRKIIYSGDTLPVKELFEEAKNAVLIHEATFKYKRDTGFYHSSIEEVCELAKKYGVRKLILMHFSRRYKKHASLEKFAKRLFESIIVAKDGMKIVV